MLGFFHRASIARKLTVATMLTTGAALLIVLVVLVFSEVLSRRSEQLRHIASLADVTAANSRAAIAFGDQKAALDILSALSQDKTVVVAALYGGDGRIFAEYHAADHNDAVSLGALPRQISHNEIMDDGRHFLAMAARVHRPVLLKGEPLGLIVIDTDLSGMWITIGYRIAVLVGAAIVSFWIALWLARGFRMSIAAPISRLVGAASNISTTRDYSIRVRKRSDDELGVLIDAFNEMLTQIEHRDAEVARARDNLEEQVRLRTAELERAKEAAETASRAKSEFLATMSHEIRTPMNGVLGVAEVLLATAVGERQRRLAENIKHSGEHLLSLINNILDFSKIEASRLELESIPFEPGALVEDVTSLFAQSAQSKGLELICDVPPSLPSTVMGDPNRLRQILGNLIGNAVKFTDQGRVIVRAFAVSSTPDMLTFEVEDTGIGVAEASRERIFDSFTQADGSTTRKYGGSGLGLAICKRLVGLMSGEIGLRSDTSGSTFWFRVPLRTAAPPAPVAPETVPLALHKMHILLVGGHPAAQKVLHQWLDHWHLQYERAHDARSALTRLRRFSADRPPIDLVVIDTDMPTADSSLLAETFEQQSDLRAVRRLLLSSITAANQPESERDAGRLWRLPKPLRGTELLKTLTIISDNAPSETPPALIARNSLLVRKPLAGRKILLAEDTPVNQEVTIEMLHLLGAEANVAQTGREAYTAYCNSTFDLILMDCQMPDMDGYKATKAIRRHETQLGIPRVPIVAVTANAVMGDREACLAAGMDDYLSKPFTLSQLMETALRWLPATGPAPSQSEPSVGLPAPSTAGDGKSPLNINTLESMRQLQALSGSNLIERVVSAYLAEAPKRLEALKRAAEARDSQSLKQVAHAWKSSSLNVGAEGLADSLRKLEQLGRSGAIQDAGDLVKRVDTEFTRVAEALSQELSH